LIAEKLQHYHGAQISCCKEAKHYLKCFPPFYFYTYLLKISEFLCWVQVTEGLDKEFILSRSDAIRSNMRKSVFLKTCLGAGYSGAGL
jgi:hypothetical protein